MTQTATVIQVLGSGKAVIRVKRVSACGENCAHCSVSCADRANQLEVRAENAVGAQVGDTVEVASSSKKVLGAAALVYLVPVALFLLGAIIATVGAFSEPVSALICVAGFMVGVIAAVLYNKKVTANRGICHTIVKIVK